MKNFRIQTRIFILALIPTIVLSLLLGTYIVSTRIHDLEKELNLHAGIILDHIVNSSRRSILQNNRQALQDLTNLLLDEDELQSVTFFGAHHELLAYSGNEDPLSSDYLKNVKFSNDQIYTIHSKNSITFTAPIIANDLNLSTPAQGAKPFNHRVVLGWAAITLSRTQTVLQEYQAIIVTLIILAFGMVISILLARRSAKKLADPLLTICSAVKKLEQGQLETRLETTSNGEIRELEEGINKMAATLMEGRDELQNNIDQATSDLKQSLETIERNNIELAHAQKEILESSRIKSEFIANMSHEIRTPMNGIIGFTNLLLETTLTILQRNYLSTIQKATFNLLHLVNNILDFSRLDAGQLNLESLTFDLEDCIEEVAMTKAPLAHAKHLELAVLIDEDVPRKIIGDPLRLKQIMANLVSNAIKFTDSGEVIIHVCLEKKTQKTVKLRINITDTGIGLQPSDQKIIFRAFQQADNSIARKYGGTGLGLAICKKLIDQMAGKIGLESTKGKGSTFWFTFSADRPSLDLGQETPSNDFTNINCFIFEKHDATRKSIERVIKHWQIQAKTFSELPTLLQELNQGATPTFIIAGINQQDRLEEDQVDILQYIKQHYEGPVLVLTNSSEQAGLDYFSKKGATICLSKPISRNMIYYAISQMIDPNRNLATALPQHTLKTQEALLRIPGKHILCVDDNVSNVNLLSALLQQTEAKLTIAHDGLEAVELAEKHHFDLILMDIRMPKMDGIEAAKHIRQPNSRNHHTPIIAISAHLTEYECHSLKNLGFNDYLTKPVIKKVLLTAIKNSMQEIQLHNQLVDLQECSQPDPKTEIANEMLGLLINSLPQEFADIKESYTMQRFEELLQRVHKLHGAICYCGVPPLKAAISELESVLKKGELNKLADSFFEFEMEVNHVLSQASAGSNIKH